MHRRRAITEFFLGGAFFVTAIAFAVVADADRSLDLGPAAALVVMFALGIIDKTTPGELNGGERVAGTGTITASGTVGPIGGIRQKLYGAEAAGAKVFLAPKTNCDEVVGHVPAGLDVYAVSTLDQAVTDLQTIAAGRSGRT